MKPLTIPVILAGASLTVLAIAAKASSLSLDFSRTVSNTNHNSLVSSDIKIDNANNIYVVNGINNALEALDTSAWYSPAISPNGTVEINLNHSGDIYFLDGINNTLQVLDDTNTGLFQTASSPTSAEIGNAFLLDEFNTSLEITDPNTTGLIAASGRRNGLINLPNSALDTDDYYVVDGFNNNLEVTNRNGSGLGTPETEVNSVDAIANFFTGGSTVEDLASNQDIFNFSGGESSTEFGDNSLEEIVNDIASGPFNGTSDADLEAQILDSIGNPNRELGWIKDLSVDPIESGGKNVSFGRSVNSGNWAIDSLISGNLEESGNFYIVDGFNNALQVIKTQDGLLVADGTGVYLVDGINNRLQVSDIDSQFSAFGSNSSSASYQENQASLPASAAETGQNDPPDPDFLNFLADYSSDDVAPNAWLDQLTPETLDSFLAENPSAGNAIEGEFLYFLAEYASGNLSSELPEGSAPGEFSAEGIPLDFLDSAEGEQFVLQTDVTANQDRDYYQAEALNNRIELVNREGDVFTISDGQFAVDGSGNVYVARGINNRIRIPIEGVDIEEAEAASVPEPSSVFGLVLLGSGAAVAKCKKKGNPGNNKK